MNRMKFRSTLLRVSDQLNNQQLDHLKFISRTVISNARMDRVRSALDLFNALEERGKLSADNIDYLHCVLISAGCHEAAKQLQMDGFHYNGMGPTDEEYRFRELLLKVAMDLSSPEFDGLKYCLKSYLKQSTDRIYSATELFQLLQQRQIVTSTNLKNLYEALIEVGRLDLSQAVNQYMLSINRQPYQLLNQAAHSYPPDLPPAGQMNRPIEESPLNHPNPQHPTISSGFRTNASSLASPPPMTGSGRYMESPSSSNTLSTMGSSQSGTTLSSLQTSPSQVSMGNDGKVYVHSPQGPVSPHHQGDTGIHIAHPLQGSGSPHHQGDTGIHFAHPLQGSGSPHHQGDIGVHIAHPLQGSESPHHQGDTGRFYAYLSHGSSGNSSQFGSSEIQLQPNRFTFNPYPPENPQLTHNQQLQKELMEKTQELTQKEQDILHYHAQLTDLHAHIGSVHDEHKGKEQLYQQKISDLEGVLGTMTREAQLHRQEMQRLHDQLQQAIPRSPQDDEDFYKMKKSPHGICFIINNHQFYHRDPSKRHPERGGANVDVHNLKQTFRYLCYKVEVVENLSSSSMKEHMLKMGTRDHSQYDSFVCCILTHGERDVVHGSDCEPVNLNDLAGVMKMCPSLHGKPKIFFIQACRGEAETKGIELPEHDAGGGPYHNTIPQEADFYFGFATPIGNSAYRSRRYGSWFISELCQVFIKHAYSHDLGAMMVKVNKRVSDAYTKDGFKQAPESVNRLRYQVSFFRFMQSRAVAEQ